MFRLLNHYRPFLRKGLGFPGRKLCSKGKVSVVEETLQKYKQGDKLHGYVVEKVASVPELHLTTVRLTHEKTGAQHLHLARQDSNNAFSVAFRTTPMDSTGVPHILEHTTLCGSQEYPVRDPFFKMLNRSLATFMNAFTGSDWTMYPFSTQNSQDYENLMSVYLDAVFNPRLREEDFRQEGWRLEHEDNTDSTSPIIFKGVVFNEMKGVFSNPQYHYAQSLQNKLFPSHTYSVVSGGDPICIPDLTWDQLKEFHARHYHPSNSKFFTYGDFPLEVHLERINSAVLQHYEKMQPNTAVPNENKWTEGREVHITCQPDPFAPDFNKQTTTGVAYLLGDITDPYETAVASLIGSLLVQGETSPFYQTLLESNIGKDYTPVVGHDGNKKEGYFCVGLAGVASEEVERVRGLVDATFDGVVQNGIEQERIDALMHKIELSMKHQTPKFGLNLIVGLAGAWNHDGDPAETLQINKLLERFKQNMKDNPKYIQDWVKKNFQDNPHKLYLTMSPEDGFEKRKQEEEKTKLDEKLSALTEQDKADIFSKGLQLAEAQNAAEDLSCLPTLKVSDITRVKEHSQTDIVYADGVICIQYCPQPTNEVTYFRAIVDTFDLPSELKPYVTLFTNVVTKMGAGEMDFKQLSQQIDMKTGGLYAINHLAMNHNNLDSYEQGILLSSHCLDRNVEDMFHLWGEIFHRLDLSDTNHLMTIIRMTAADLVAGLSDSGHNYANTHAGSHLVPLGKAQEQLGGMEQVLLMKKIAEMTDLTPVVKSMQLIAEHVMNSNNIRCAVNASPESMSDVTKHTEDFLRSLPGKPHLSGLFMRDVTNFEPTPSRVHFECPFQVNFMGKAVRTVPYVHEDYASLRVLARLLTAKYLHREIREKGGAYGGGATAARMGLLSFYSYRDPNSLNTLTKFDESTLWAAEGKFTEQDIDEAKLAVFQEVDQPVAPGDKGMVTFLTGITDEMKQIQRERLFDANRKNLMNVAQKYLVPEKQLSSVAFLGPENATVKQDDKWEVRVQNN
ncbi:presequence protease, mitochondrial-like isoform X1 [Lineus longissimus]|uniref:presequence protease, mitochondrial-like isoform X1 n=1 Tax=Lineus longissimus TaxID=88925 RepID=UPI002B4C8FC3